VASRDHRGGCRPSMAAVEVTTWYVSGPMRNYPRWNYDAFDDAAAFLTRRGENVISPADIDRELGVDENAAELPDWFTLEDAMRRDLKAVTGCDALLLLQGWVKSVGATREVLTAVWCGLPVYRYFSDPANPFMTSMTHDQVLYAISPSVALKGND
jgi:hypothetical protein